MKLWFFVSKYLRILIYILIVLALLFNSFGYLVAFILLRNSAWAESKARIEKEISPDELVRFEIPKFSDRSNLPNVEDCQMEFSYSGTMYDVIRRYETSDSVFLDCLRDEQEEELIEAFLKNHNKTNSGSSFFHVLAKWQHVPVYYQNVPNVETTHCSEFDNRGSNPKPQFYNSILSEIDTPPPRAV